LIILDGPIGRVSHARKRRKAWAANSPGRIGNRDPSACAQYRMRDGELMRRCPHIHVGIMEDEILNVNKLARNPHAGGRIKKMTPFAKPLPYGTAPHRLVEACEVILRPTDRRQEGLERQIRDIITHWNRVASVLIRKLS